jgi:O-methyltransferase
MKPISLFQAKHVPIVKIAKAITPPVIWQWIYKVLVIKNIPDAERYGMVYRPWLESDKNEVYERCKSRTLISPEGCYYLSSRLRQSLNVSGSVYELGVYKGGSARIIKEATEGSGKILRLFDSFSGMKSTNPDLGDRHQVGDFSDTSLSQVKAFVGTENWIDYRQGWVPNTFDGLEGDSIAFAHIDLDLHDPIVAACQFIYPRLSRGGTMIFDDYGFPSTPGARLAIDSFFFDKSEVPMVLQTGQAIVVKL